MNHNQSLPDFPRLFSEKYPAWSFLLSYFRCATGFDAQWHNLNVMNLCRFADHLKANYAPNTVAQYITRFRAVASIGVRSGILSPGTLEAMTIKSERAHHIYLTEAEIAMLGDVETASPKQLLVKTSFLIGVATLARHSDCLAMSKANIRGDMLEYVSKKTHVIARIPATASLEKLLEQQSELIKTGVSVSKAGFNLILRHLGRQAGITAEATVYRGGRWLRSDKCDFLTSHAARRSSITNLYLRGVDLETIAMMAGHESVVTTRRYLCCTERPIPAAAMRYFTELA